MTDSKEMSSEEWKQFKEENKNIFNKFNSNNPLRTNYELVSESNKEIFNEKNYQNWRRAAFREITFSFKIKKYLKEKVTSLKQFFCFHKFKQKYSSLKEIRVCEKCNKFAFGE